MRPKRLNWRVSLPPPSSSAIPVSSPRGACLSADDFAFSPFKALVDDGPASLVYAGVMPEAEHQHSSLLQIILHSLPRLYMRNLPLPDHKRLRRRKA
jgi:hypothetical protein